MKFTRPSLRRGSALIAVYWTIGILSLAVFTTAQLVLFEVKTSSSEELVFRAELLADSAIAIAAHPDTEPYDPLLSQQISDTEGFAAHLSSEGERLNLNALLTLESRPVIERLFESWGLSEIEADSIINSLIDWTDSDDRSTDDGWEERQYLRIGVEDAPFDRAFQTLDEVPLVAGFDRVIAVNPRWKEAFTLRSSGKLDLSVAPPELIAIACDCTPETAADFVGLRNGPDGLPHTEDDVPFANVEEAFDLLRRGEGDRERLRNWVSVDDPVERIVGVGQSGDVIVTRAVVLRDRESQRPVVLDVETTATFLEYELTE